MKRTIMAGAGALALALATAPAALATQNDTPDYGVTTTTITPQDQCGTFVVTWTNPTEWKFWGDYRVGNEPGEADDATGAGPIAEGPLKDEPFGKTYHQTPIAPNGGENSKTITVPEGTEPVSVSAWVKRGPEQKSFSTATPVSITPCEPADDTTPDNETPPTDGEDNQPADDIEQVGDDANEDGTAPTPTPQEGHVAVTG